MGIAKIAAAVFLALSIGSAIGAQSPATLTPPVVQPARARAVTPLATPVSGVAPLVRADLEAWLDGYMPFALSRGNIAGAVVVVVKDGAVLLQKGYGVSDVARARPVDPETTLFRPGSVSKLVTWTAVMQLVEAGKLDLDRDVNSYLDFKIPPYKGRPVTLRNILTHTAGFEESVRYLIGNDPKKLMPLGDYARRALPARVFAPGTTPAYSNYATALAGHIVARTSGMSFDDYVDRNIFRPIGMTSATFRQPLPGSLAARMSRGYALASQDPKPFEIVTPAPAGSLSASGADMGKFMIAHLANGRGLLRPETATAMHGTKLTLLPPLNRMALGFYEDDINGRRVVAHGGDTQYFHSNLALFLDEGVGLFVSVNSAGVNGASGPLRSALFEGFADRYFPAPRAEPRVPAATAREHARAMVGTYTSSRGAFTNFVQVLGLFGQAKIGVDKDGALSVPAVTGLANQPRKWVEIAPYVWRDAASGERLAAKLEDGRVVRWSFDTVAPFTVYDRTPWYLDSSWLLPVAGGSLLIVLLTALAWPAGAISRRRYRSAHNLQGRALGVQRLVHGFSWATVVALGLWAYFITTAFAELHKLSGPLDWLLVTLQILTPVALIGLVALAAWNHWIGWRGDKGHFSRLWSVLLLLAALMLLWVAIGFDLIGFGTTY